MAAVPSRSRRVQNEMQISGESAIIVAGEAGRAWLCGDEQAKLLLLDAEGNTVEGLRQIESALSRLGECRVGVDPDIPATTLLRLQNAAAKPSHHFEWKVTSSLTRCRTIKDDEEISTIARAASITRKLLDDLVDVIQPDVSEAEISHSLSTRLLELGGDGFAFDPSIGSGPRGATPWAGVTLRRVANGEPIVVDCGAMLRGYRSDMTRTYFVGGIPGTRSLRRMNETVLETMATITQVLKPGVSCRALHQLCEETLRELGWTHPMRHALGHGVGLQLHERPYLSSTSVDVLAAGMVVAIEPGAYDDSLGGVRTEEMFVITSYGARRLGDEIVVQSSTVDDLAPHWSGRE